MVKKLALFLLLGLLISCVSKLDSLRHTRPIGTQFQIALASEYLQFAESEADQYDWFDSDYFAKKGLKAAWGNDVEPERVEYWDVPRIERPILEQARQYLMQVLTPKIIAEEPKLAARAQFLFDCWIEQQEERWQQDHITACREEFYDKLDRMFALSAPKMPPIASTKPAMIVETNKEDNKISQPNKAENLPMGSYTIFFDFNKFNVKSNFDNVLADIVKDAKARSDYEINLNGYTDSMGKKQYNMELSKKRASAVKDALVKKGLDANKIMIFAFGEEGGNLTINNSKGATRVPKLKHKNYRRVEVEIR